MRRRATTLRWPVAQIAIDGASGDADRAGGVRHARPFRVQVTDRLVLRVTQRQSARTLCLGALLAQARWRIRRSLDTSRCRLIALSALGRGGRSDERGGSLFEQWPFVQQELLQRFREIVDQVPAVSDLGSPAVRHG